MTTCTRTGALPIGFRRGGSPWQKDLGAVLRFAKDSAFAGIDVGSLEAAEVQKILDAGLKIGSVDLKQPWNDLCCTDAGRRRATVDVNVAYIRAMLALGVTNFFCVMIPDNHAGKRTENMDLAVAGYGALCAAVAGTPARIVIEGWPGGAPHYSSLCCTPESYRTFFKAVASDIAAVNFAPSHLVRMGIDPLRFLGEFAPRVAHAHGKDTELFADALYEYGNLQGATTATAKGHGYGGLTWRYAIPGHGGIPWSRLLAVLKDAGYKGMIFIELEDENFSGSEEGEKRGLCAARDFLMHV